MEILGEGHQIFQISSAKKSLYARGRKRIHLLAGETISANLLTRKSTETHINWTLGNGVIISMVEIKPVSFHIIHSLLYETNVISVTRLVNSYVKSRSFYLGYGKHEQEKYIISYKTSAG